jgi:hypothetical protein
MNDLQANGRRLIRSGPYDAAYQGPQLVSILLNDAIAGGSGAGIDAQDPPRVP